MQNKETRSATVAGTLGILLGWVGAHNWYLGEKKKGMIHVALASSSLVIEFLVGVIWPSQNSITGLIGTASSIIMLAPIVSLLMFASEIWGIIEAVKILQEGDAGMIRRGFNTSASQGSTQSTSAPQSGFTPQGFAQPAAATQPGFVSQQNPQAPASTPPASVDHTAPTTPTTPVTNETQTMQAPAQAPAQFSVQNTPMSQPNQAKQPMDPKKKTALILGLAIGIGVLALVIVLTITVVPAVTKVDYGETYRAAKNLKKVVKKANSDSHCNNIKSEVNSSHTDMDEYDNYIEKCKIWHKDLVADDLISELEDTDGVKKNDKISEQFKRFKAEYEALHLGDISEMSKILKTYQAMHNFTYASSKINEMKPTDDGVETAASYLINSGNKTLKTYGEGWRQRYLTYNVANRNYKQSLTTASINELQSLIKAQNNAKSEVENFESTSRPRLEEIAPLPITDAQKMTNEFSKLYDLIKTTYEENYDEESGDCPQVLGEVICE